MNFVVEVMSYIVVAPWLGLLDTGAVHGMVGLPQFKQYDSEVLKPLGLGCVKIAAPKSAGGVGGKARVLGAFIVPIGLGGVPGVLAVIIVDGLVPWLLPLGLLRALKAHIMLDEGIVKYNVEQGAQSVLVHLPSGHDAVDITEGLSSFKDVIPESEKSTVRPTT